jgi:hypothetical protein
MKIMEIAAPENDAGLLDFLAVIAENLKLLVFGPILIGLIAIGTTFLLPQKFTSKTYLNLGDGGKAVEAVIRSPAVLDVVLSQFPAMSGGGGADLAREALNRRIRFSAGASSLKGGAVLTQLDVDDASPQQSQALANAVIDAWLATSRPQPNSKLELERQLKLNQAALETVAQMISRVSDETTKITMPNLQFDLVTPTVALFRLRNGYVDTIASIELQLRGTTRDIVFSPPGLPTNPSGLSKILIALLAALATGVALLLWIFMHHAWCTAAQDPIIAAQQTKLLRAMGFRQKSA